MQFTLPKAGIEVLAGMAPADVKKPLEMIEPRAPHRDLRRRHVKNPRHVVTRHEQPMAQADRPYPAMAAQRQDDTIFRVGEVDEQRLRTALLHVPHDIEDKRQGAEREEQAAGPAILAERMADAVLAGDFEIELPQPQPVNDGRIDHESGAVESRSPFGRVFDREP